MTSKTFVSGTVIDSAWLNDVNDATYAADTAPVGSFRALLESTQGAANVGGSTQAVSSLTDLRALLKTSASKYAYVSGHTSAGDGGGGFYWYDSTDVSSADNDGTIIVASDGGRWKLVTNGINNLFQHGALGDGTTDVSTILQKPFTQGGGWHIPKGVYKFNTGLVSDYSDLAFPALSFPSIRYDICGDALANTLLEFGGSGTAITSIGSGTTVGEGIHSFDRLANFSLYPTGRGGTEIGITLTRKAYATIENVAIDYFVTGLFLNSCLTSVLKNVHVRNGIDGIALNDSPSFSRPNSLLWERVTVLSNEQHGVIANILGAGNQFIGLNVEMNGRHGVAGDAGFIANVNGDNGIASVSFDGCYFEGNGGDADLYITNTSAASITVVIKGSVFNRTSNTRYCANNIKLVNSAGGKIKCVLIGCGFMSSGTYIPSAARPFISADANSVVIDVGCTYSETTSKTVNPIANITDVASATATSGVATTVYTLPNLTGSALYQVHASVGAAGDAANFGASALVYTDGASTRIASVNNATLQTISLSGLAIQTTQTSGASQTAVVSVTRLA